ncbi:MULTISPECIES: hypothetical protein [Xanthomonas]|uniref:Uncharacterized protein n=1 Tax=Xanthomonas sacchari TaxID=56458 RepID=A0AA46SPF1_9XANT|nr:MULTISPECIES: hypothetical protein [Xanthomonas]MCW0366357.1 hypothetical protein [Xanthomonas sacchari]MCW0392889.1 hypothetical protein [Xanthomonas sacchari]MCW0396807.1 hypothetical protein [Xanthomonas sacchari]MCW0436425.1 hypothetical protein [Xanthomonas sacchari]MCW0440618.1 hypothetical protein [Xanthomonas sacchari]
MKIKPPAFAIAICLSSLSLNAMAGEYTETGYLRNVKANNTGSTCFFQIAGSPTGHNFQGGEWYCGDIAGQNILKLAQTAQILQMKVKVILEGDGAAYKPVKAVELAN